MGSTNSCLPGALNSFHTLRHHSSTSKLKYDVEEVFNSHKNAININQVSEDELLLLPGITRQLAVNIVQYRHLNDGFKKVDEILRVNGITFNLFKHIYADITIDLSPSSENKQEPVNLNLASYKELCSVPGLTPNLVERIIQRRERKGLFRFIEDLLKIKGIDYIILAAVRPHVTVNQHQLPTSISDTSIDNFYPLSNRNHPRDTLSLASILLETLPPELHTLLVASPPHRPLTTNNNNNNNKHNIFRFASWNLQQLTNEKVRNPGVREVICRIILENNFSLIGIQEIGNKESLDSIIQELNNPTIPLIKDWPNRHQGKWNFTISDIAGQMSQGSEYLGFLYDESIGIELKQASSLSFSTYFTRSPYITIFRLYNKLELVFVNIHLKSKGSDEDRSEGAKDEVKALSVLAQAIKNTIEQKHVIIFGNFNIIPTASEFEALIKFHYSYVIQENTDTNLQDPQGSASMDNIWLSAEAKTLSTGNSGVIRDNLSSMWIPTGWTWGGLVSNHCPIWIEFDLS